MAVSCPAVGSAGARGNRGLTVRGGPDPVPSGQPARVRSRRNAGAARAFPAGRAVEQGEQTAGRADGAGAHGLPVAGEIQPTTSVPPGPAMPR